MTKVAVIAVSMALLAAACAGSSDPPGAVTEPGSNPGTSETVINLVDNEIVFTAALSTFDECESLLDHLRSEYAERVGPWGFETSSRHGPGIPEPDMAGEDVAADDSDSGSAEAASVGLVEGADYSGTNVQEAGVDEADLVKTDGRRIFVVSNERLSVIDTAAKRVVGSVGIASGFNTEMFLDGDDLLVIVNGHSPPVEIAAAATTDGLAGYDEPVTVVQRVRVDGDTPRVVETMRVKGTYVSARSVDGVARVVTHHDLSRSLPFVYPQGGSSRRVAEETNRAMVLAATLEDWLPSYVVTSGAGDGLAEGSLLPACENVYVPSEFAEVGVTTVMSLPVSGPLDGDSAVSVVAPGDAVYATPQSLYVATSTWIAPELLEDEATRQQIAEDWQTAVHRFDLTDPARAAYVASGSVPGRIRSQFSLSEHDSHLRVVTTTGDLWWQQNEPSSSQVRVLRQTGERLVEVGSVGDIGRGEQVQSVRFAGDVGYVVTFRLVDPFYTLDLSDPQNPAILGELKIPGFSRYLHPIGDGLVLGIGFDADESTGAVTGSKASLFDVSDLADPREIAVQVVSESWGADVVWDHRAFLWWDPARLAVFGIANWAGRWSEAVALRVEGDSLIEIGRIDHTDPNDDIGSTDCRKFNPIASLERSNFDLWHTLTFYDVIACEPGERQTIVGYTCSPVDWVRGGNASGFDEEARSSGVTTDDETMFACLLGSMDVIVRSLVIGDELWTLSYSSGHTYESKLAASDLNTLERIALIRLP